MVDTEIGLTQAAVMLRVSWHCAWRLVLVGELDGRKDGNRWLVSRPSVERYASKTRRSVSKAGA